jgi:hypothetical protein
MPKSVPLVNLPTDRVISEAESAATNKKQSGSLQGWELAFWGTATIIMYVSSNYTSATQGFFLLSSEPECPSFETHELRLGCPQLSSCWN